VSLRSLSPEALDSFLRVISSLKLIASSIASSQEISFTIQEGSASFAVVESRNSNDLDEMYSEMERAINGDSENKSITSNLRVIQTQFKREEFNYSFNYNKSQGSVIELHSLLLNAKKITVKRRRRAYTHKVKIISGFLNLIGGKNPNYHFDNGAGISLTIDCSQDDAKEVNKYLYQTIDVLVVCKEWTNEDKKDVYFHKTVIRRETVRLLKSFLREYYRKSNLLDKLRAIHDFTHSCINRNDFGFEILGYLLVAFNDNNFHLSEIKTLLVISKQFKENALIAGPREQLLTTYEIKLHG